ncbi:hypothetical protein COU62_01045 [Candidatus Pacearchaeota archaeon CG10_big_fil_rev_8_21_14_0_10_35_219]|nr:PKD domain-containing protein [Candidatus Pacearchaeota archaeon]OIO43024.1 MAG: hypothetical protein AUJ63_01215 [Candidatus Pacearchaeota archaeon CG1_02_35_32]PIO08150.1 MAG: hypothetical protein COU62_01045 [Candidatus Pacearchaeota archaeon CG10_big_fil_rev_8_21_14_0_10_35_219]PIY81084.1 MAG: hypothetical protein COY79_04755 [Candidatus Pacearchaeota archaeon CG_4_10_14_0_8_um_filter_35_169]PIZ79956.1 MAG: hypothetical protein COY00_03060 [Candidatus Pacearchaeota archaeon CG_4_10_14_0_
MSGHKKDYLYIGLVILVLSLILMVNSIPGVYLIGPFSKISLSPGYDNPGPGDAIAGLILLGIGILLIAKSRKTRGQASIEFLMTYGWTILAVLVAVGVLAYFGVFSSGSLTSTTSVVSPPFTISSFGVVDSEVDEIVFELGNGGGYTLRITQFELINPRLDGGLLECSSGFNVVYDPIDCQSQFEPGSKCLVKLQCSSGEIKSGDFFNSDFEVTYQKSGGALDSIASGSVSIIVQGEDSGGNQAPISDFGFSPPNPEVNTEVVFDASSSYDPDGTIVEYRWDWENDGIVDYTTTEKTASHMFTIVDTYEVKLTVEDTIGQTDDMIVPIQVNSWIYNSMLFGMNFDDVNGGNPVDLSGNGLDGTLYGGASLVPAKLGNGLDFDGNVGTFMGLGNWNSVDLSSGYSISMWVYRKSDVAGALFKKGNGLASHGRYAQVQFGTSNSGDIDFYMGDGINVCRAINYATDSITSGNWHHIVITVDSTKQVTLYADEGVDLTQSCGALTGTYTDENAAFSGVLKNDGGYLSFDVTIDEFYIFDKVLTTDEIHKLFTLDY